MNKKDLLTFTNYPSTDDLEAWDLWSKCCDLLSIPSGPESERVIKEILPMLKELESKGYNVDEYLHAYKSVVPFLLDEHIKKN